ncbi:MAG TPA: GNAT family N-acetyltransferase [Rhizomicrobium sp.]|nr:GNAT family N-acetyltransferase [Rhizomicrobium sp.]
MIETSTDIGAFAATWPTLSDIGGDGPRSYPFQCRDHLEIWLETIGAASGVRPLFVRVSNRKGEPLLSIPLGIQRRAGIRVLGFLDGGVCDYNAPVIHAAAAEFPRQDMLAVWASILQTAPAFDVASLQKIPEFVAERSNPLHWLAAERWPQSGHFVSLKAADGPIEAKGDVKESRRRRQRLSEIGKLAFHIARDDGEILNVFEIFVRQKSRRYRETLGHDGFDVPGQRSYYLELTRRLSGRGVQLSWLSVGEEVIATAWSLVTGPCLYYMMCAYEDGAWAKFAPGRLLLEELIGWCPRNGIETFDFGIGDESYKLRWRQTSFPLGGRTQPRTMAGSIWRAAVRTRAALRRRLREGSAAGRPVGCRQGSKLPS